MAGQLHDVIRRSCPENETVPRILETRLNLGILKPQQDGVDIQLLEL
jgi:hypothetical protein